MPIIEIDPLSVSEIDLISDIAPKFEEVLLRRHGFQAEDLTDSYASTRDCSEDAIASKQKAYGISGTVVLPSDFLPNDDARSDLRKEHRSFVGAIEEQGIELGFLPRLAITGNLATEINLPQFQSVMMEKLVKVDGKDSTPASIDAIELFQSWVRTWTAEENFHEVILRDAGLASEVVNPRELDLTSIDVATHPLGINFDGIVSMWSYLTIQEKSTVISHKLTGSLFSRSIRRMMWKVSANESTHEKVNTDLLRMSLEAEPNHTVQAYYKQVRNFFMPGKEGIPFFKSFTEEMAISGIFDFVALRALIRSKTEELGIKNLNLSGRAADYRDRLFEYINDTSGVNRRLDGAIEAERQRRIGEAAKRGKVAFILGRTVTATRDQDLSVID